MPVIRGAEAVQRAALNRKIALGPEQSGLVLCVQELGHVHTLL
jgi:hypothetical protein